MSRKRSKPDPHQTTLNRYILGLPLALVQHELARHRVDMRTRLAMALTCHAAYEDVDWRRTYAHAVLLYDMEDPAIHCWPTQRVFDVFAPYIETLTYHLPCHHMWFLLSLERCTRLRHLHLVGPVCYGLEWDKPFPPSLESLTLGPRCGRNDVDSAVRLPWMTRWHWYTPGNGGHSYTRSTMTAYKTWPTDMVEEDDDHSLLT